MPGGRSERNGLGIDQWIDAACLDRDMVRTGVKLSAQANNPAEALKVSSSGFQTGPIIAPLQPQREPA